MSLNRRSGSTAAEDLADIRKEYNNQFKLGKKSLEKIEDDDYYDEQYSDISGNRKDAKRRTSSDNVLMDY